MTKTRSITRNQNHDDASSRKRIETCDPWSDLNHDVLLLVMMQLRAIDFLAFSSVCKSWRSLAVCNKNKFIVSRPTMSISISSDADEKHYCYLNDFEGRKLKTIFPEDFADTTCIRVTCGYLISSGKKTKDFLLVNPITRNELHFPFPDVRCYYLSYLRAILVFSPSISGWVFVVFTRCYYHRIWFCVGGKREWSYVSTPFHILDLQAFKGKIYTLHCDKRLCEMRLYQTPKVTLLEIKNSPKSGFSFPLFASSSERLYVRPIFKRMYKIHEIDIGEMQLVSRETEGDEYAFFCSYSADHVIQVESWADLSSKSSRYALPNVIGKGHFFSANMWYFFHDCLNAN